jgi:TIGR03009 family protein
MQVRSIAYAASLLILAARSVQAQSYPLPPPGKVAEKAGAQMPTGQTVSPSKQHPAPPRPPFTLTPQQAAQVDRVLNQWEERNRGVKTFDCRFKRWIYDVVFGPPNRAKFVETGAIRYAAPDRGLFRLETSEKDGKETPIDDARAEHWVADGKSIFEYCPAKKQLIEHRLPPELRGKAIANTPLPFLFGAEAQKLKERYFIRIITPPEAKGEIWLEAFPRFQQDAANFQRAQFIITAQDMTPFALKLIQPNGKDYTVYQFYDVVLNDKFKIFQGDPFRPFTPLGWQKIVEEPPGTPKK